MILPVADNNAFQQVSTAEIIESQASTVEGCEGWGFGGYLDILPGYTTSQLRTSNRKRAPLTVKGVTHGTFYHHKSHQPYPSDSRLYRRLLNKIQSRFTEIREHAASV